MLYDTSVGETQPTTHTIFFRRSYGWGNCDVKKAIVERRDTTLQLATLFIDETDILGCCGHIAICFLQSDRTVGMEGIERESSVVKTGRRAFPLRHQQHRVDLSTRTPAFGRCPVFQQEWERIEDALPEV